MASIFYYFLFLFLCCSCFAPLLMLRTPPLSPTKGRGIEEDARKKMGFFSEGGSIVKKKQTGSEAWGGGDEYGK